MALIAIVKHPNGARIEYSESKGIQMMEQRWSTGETYRLPRSVLTGLLQDIRHLGGSVIELQAHIS